MHQSGARQDGHGDQGDQVQAVEQVELLRGHALPQPPDSFFVGAWFQVVVSNRCDSGVSDRSSAQPGKPNVDGGRQCSVMAAWSQSGGKSFHRGAWKNLPSESLPEVHCLREKPVVACLTIRAEGRK